MVSRVYLEEDLGLGGVGGAGDLDDIADAEGDAVEGREEEEGASGENPSQRLSRGLVAMDPSSGVLRHC